MTSDVPAAGGPQPVRGPDAPSKRTAQAPADGPAFQVLLEKLEQQAAGLRAKSAGLERPEDLAGAVEEARESLEDALSLGAELLEAYRAARRAPPAPDGAREAREAREET